MRIPRPMALAFGERNRFAPGDRESEWESEGNKVAVCRSRCQIRRCASTPLSLPSIPATDATAFACHSLSHSLDVSLFLSLALALSSSLRARVRRGYSSRGWGRARARIPYTRKMKTTEFPEARRERSSDKWCFCRPSAFFFVVRRQ